MRIKVKIGADVFERDLPEIPSDISLSKYCKIESLIKERGLDNNELFDIPFCIRVISAYFDLSDRQASSFLIKGEDNIFNVVSKIINVIGAYRYEPNRKFTVNNQVFELKASYVKEQQLKASEAIEVMEVIRLTKQQDKQGIASKSDLNYTRIVKTLATLARAKDDEFPIYQPDVDAFIDERTQFFHNANVSMQVGLDAVFFLTTITKRLKELEAFTSFLTPRQEVEKQQQNEKR